MLRLQLGGSVMYMDGSHGFHELTRDGSTWPPAAKMESSSFVSENGEPMSLL